MNLLRSMIDLRVPIAALAVVSSATACGRDVETCDTACAILHPYGPFAGSETPPLGVVDPTCIANCTADESRATRDGDGARFQLLLTCLGNANSFSPLCLPLACGLTDAFGKPSCGGTPIADGGVDGCTGYDGYAPPIGIGCP